MTDPQREAPIDDLSQAAAVTPTDRIMAPRFWAHYATPLLRALLGAVRQEKV